MKNNIQDKVVIITGASSGLGEATAKHLADLGAKVVLFARRKDRLDAIAESIKNKGGNSLVIVGDVTKQADLESAVEQTLEHFGRVDVLVNNAGIMPMAPMSMRKVSEWDKMIDVNIKGVLYGISAVLPTMQSQKSGHIINLSSVAGLKVSAGIGTVYSATKFAVKAISEGLRVELKDDNIRVTTLYPGAVDSELKLGSSESFVKEALENFYKQYQIPADSVARAVAYAMEQPDDVVINEITIRPTNQEF